MTHFGMAGSLPDWLQQPAGAAPHAPYPVPGAPGAAVEFKLQPPGASPQPTGALVVHSRHLWLGNLTEPITDDDLRRPFVAFGQVDGVKTYPGRNYGFVTMTTVSAAVAALNALNGTPLGGPAVRIEFAKTGSPSRTLLVSHVSGQFSPDVWAQQFARYGAVIQLQFNASQASCLVEFSTVAEAVNAHNSLQGQVIAGQELVLSFTPDAAAPQQPFPPAAALASAPETGAKPHGDQPALPPSRIVWIGLPNGTQVTRHELERAFSTVGGLKKARAFENRNYAFLEFATVDDASRCIHQMQGYMLPTAGGRVRLTLKFSSGQGQASASTPSSARVWQMSSGRRRSRSRSRSRSPPRRSKRSGWDQTTPAATTPVGGSGDTITCLPPPAPPLPPHAVMQQPPLASSAQPWIPQTLQGMPGIGAPLDIRAGLLNAMPAPLYQPSLAMVTAGTPSPQLAPLQIGTAPQIAGIGGSMSGSEVQPNAAVMFGSNHQNLMAMALPARTHAAVEAVHAVAVAAPLERPVTQLLTAHITASDAAQQHHSIIASAGLGSTSAALPVEMGGPGWKGRVAKSGAPVCSLACVRGVPGQLPAELNCAARTDLQSLASHLAAVPHRVIQLAPASAADVVPLQGFITYLRDRERAGVVNVGETTLFLVPPSEWAGNVLGCEPTANLIAVILASATVPPVQQPSAPQHQQAATGVQGAPPGVPTATDLARLVAMAGGAYGAVKK